MNKYYTRPCNFYYGSKAKYFLKKKQALSLAGNTSIAFDQIEILYRKKRGIIKSEFHSVNNINKLNKKKLFKIKEDLKKITFARKSIFGLNFKIPQIMGVLNITPDSFSDGGIYFNKKKAYDHALFLKNSGATIIDIGGASTRPESNTVGDFEEWKRVENTIIKLKKKIT